MLECLPIKNIAKKSAESDYNIIFFDGMAVVNKLDIEKMKLKSGSEFASAFVQKMEKETQGFEKVHVIFDRYTEESLKYGTRTRRTGGETACYKISNYTVMEHLTTKQFLSDTRTK